MSAFWVHFSVTKLTFKFKFQFHKSKVYFSVTEMTSKNHHFCTKIWNVTVVYIRHVIVVIMWNTVWKIIMPLFKRWSIFVCIISISCHFRLDITVVTDRYDWHIADKFQKPDHLFFSLIICIYIVMGFILLLILGGNILRTSLKDVIIIFILNK